VTPCRCLRSKVYDSRLRGHRVWRRHLCHDCGRRWTTRRAPDPPRIDGPTSVYFIRAGDLVKVGIAKNTARRMAAIQSGAPAKLELLHEERYGSCAEARAKERAFQSDLWDYHVHGEWFHETPAVSQYIANMKAKRSELAQYG
jgi:hypothetical protein